MTVGCVAGDEESYEVFADLLDPVIDKRHGGYSKVYYMRILQIHPPHLHYWLYGLTTNNLLPIALHHHIIAYFVAFFNLTIKQPEKVQEIAQHLQWASCRNTTYIMILQISPLL